MNVSPTLGQRASTSTVDGTTRSKQPGQKEFMQLLAAELRNQDPMQPTEDKDFIAQIAQFNVLEQVSQLNATMDALAGLTLLTQGASLVGKRVEISPASSAGIAEGIVTEVSFRDSTMQLKVGGKLVTLGDIVAIKDQGNGSAG